MNLRRMVMFTTLAVAALFVVLSVARTQPKVSAAPAKVDLCHVTGNGSFQPISVSANAVASHLAHGDVQQPNGAVPGNPGAVFDSRCNVVSWNYLVNVAPDFSAQDPSSPGNLFVGSGIPAENFGTARNEGAGIELGLMVLYRQGPTVPSTDNYADGVLNFNVASGPQSTANGSPSNNAGRAAWNFTFSVATGLNAVPTDLDDHTFQLLYDVDPGPGATYRTLTLERRDAGGPGQLSGFQWRDQGTGTVFIGDDEGNSNVTQNSENYAFAFFQAFLGGAYAPPTFAGPGQFDIILQALNGTQIIDRNHIRVNVAP
ncbi:MAG TPA: hypothetical protein VGC60_16780 [Pyrinomonadaceae bacterium]